MSSVERFQNHGAIFGSDVPVALGIVYWPLGIVYGYAGFWLQDVARIL